MCLSLAVARPEAVLSRGTHADYDWITMHNGIGNRCGYVRVPLDHPWHGMPVERAECSCNVHGGVTFAEADTHCGGGAADDAWWLGFDCGHFDDLPDLNLPIELDCYREFLIGFRNLVGGRGRSDAFGPTVKTQEYVEQECRNLCEQAATAVAVANRLV